MRALPWRISLFLILLFLPATERVCWAVSTTDALLLYAIADSLSLDDESVLVYSLLLEDDRIGDRRCSSTLCLHREGLGYSKVFGADFRNQSPVFYRDAWFSYIGKYDLLSSAVRELLAKLSDIASRLDLLHEQRTRLYLKFSQDRDEFFLEPIDNSIKHLSALGIEVRDVSRRFFYAIKPRLIDAEIEREILDVQADAMRGLTSLERDLQGITALPHEAVDRSLEQSVAAIEKAIAELERAVAE